MINQLAGYEPLQNKILMYCLGTPSATIMKPLCAQIGAKRRDQDDEDENKITAFRYYKAVIKSSKPRKTVRSYLGWVVTEELKLIKNQNPDLREDQERIVKTISKTYLDIRLSDLTEEEENGTPTGVIMRKYIKNLLKKGYKLLKNETIWAKFSCGELISNYNHRPLTIRQIKPEVFADLTKALNEMTELRSIKNHKNY
jgi:hypothetical protein